MIAITTCKLLLTRNIVDEDGAPHMKVFTYTLKMGSYEVGALFF